MYHFEFGEFGFCEHTPPVVSEKYRWIIVLMTLLLMVGLAGFRPNPIQPITTSWLVQAQAGQTQQELGELVLALGGSITHEVAILNAVGADLTEHQLMQLQSNRSIRLLSDSQFDTATMVKRID